MKTLPDAIVLFAHGSRDPLWRAPIDAVAQSIQARAPHTPVLCAFLELDRPTLPEAVSALAQAGHSHLRIVPMFLGVGRHAREDLPTLMQQLQGHHPTLSLELMPAVGEMPAVIECLARVCLNDA